MPFLKKKMNSEPREKNGGLFKTPKFRYHQKNEFLQTSTKIFHTNLLLCQTMSPTLYGSIIFKKNIFVSLLRTLLKNVVKLGDAKLFLSSIIHFNVLMFFVFLSFLFVIMSQHMNIQICKKHKNNNNKNIVQKRVCAFFYSLTGFLVTFE